MKELFKIVVKKFFLWSIIKKRDKFDKAIENSSNKKVKICAELYMEGFNNELEFAKQLDNIIAK